ncbi:hypothetical protein Poli38472_012335 [Pythium oligandrum]|uniref:Uncharacterized protein n=1 Tax=Pythium oligandrum TaxID=41045 RepID=A0A8K1CQ70_PYTOL|nr:hypothetical protein Poli38472_012335 [Pythium oligandrum]|eukprot:TMW67219.1 hypothetical protein Poli38472_012335 [Pythium oligandrum]
MLLSSPSFGFITVYFIVVLSEFDMTEEDVVAASEATGARMVVHKAFYPTLEALPRIAAAIEYMESSECARTESESDHSSSRAESSGGENGTSVATAAPKKRRKTMDDHRKEEKAQLMAEISKLNTHLAFLSQQAVSDNSSTTLSVEGANALLRELLQQQQLRFATSRAIVSQATISNNIPPLPTRIVLSRDKLERQRVLSAMQADQLSKGRQYITERSRFLDLSESHHTMEDVVSSQGDILNVRFLIEQHNHQTVRNVFDGILYYGANIEFVLSESAECLTIREDDDDDDKRGPGIAQHVLQATVAPGVLVEHNTVVFSEFNAQEDVGLIVARFVDEDELHLYKPTERIRHDLMMIVMISKLPGTDTAVARHWAHLRWHRSEHVVVSDDIKRQVRPKLTEWVESIHRFLRVRLGNNHWERIHKKTLQEKDPDIEWDASFRKKYTTPIKDGSTLKKLQTSVAHLTGVVSAIAIHLNVAISAVDELEEYVKALEILWRLHKANPSLASVINHHPRGPAVSAYLDMHKRRTVALSKDLAVDHNAERGCLASPPAPAPAPAAKEKRKRVHLEPSLKETGVRCK